MGIVSTTSGSIVTLILPDSFDYNYHKQFREAYKATDGKNSQYIIDMSNTTYIDSSGLGNLLLLRNHAGDNHSDITIKGAKNEVKKSLFGSNYERLFKIL